jgi:chemotaxis protein methyltransferase CheR
MTATTPAAELSTQEFKLLREYIRRHCGIALGDEKAYLVDSRLSKLVAEHACQGYGDFYQLAVNDTSNRIRDKIIDAMTTNETLWFRDIHPFAILRETLLPELAAQVRGGRQTPLRIWSAACSTGQEAYSIAMTVEECRLAGVLPAAHPVQIVGTDISSSALFLARNGRYDRMAMSRGLDEPRRQRHFKPVGNVWELNPAIRQMASFSKFNLQDSPAPLGRFDIVFLRYVTIYFSDELKCGLLDRVADALTDGGCLILGAVESTRGYSTRFETLTGLGGSYYRLLPARTNHA